MLSRRVRRWLLPAFNLFIGLLNLSVFLLFPRHPLLNLISFFISLALAIHAYLYRWSG